MTPLRLAAQLAGFAIGIALLAWCLAVAWKADDGRSPWDHFIEAEWWLIAGLLVSTLVSLTANAAIFQIGFAPIRDVGFWNMQKLNVTANALNYLPLRPGVIARIAYHLRIDRIGILEIGATFAAIALVLLVVASAAGLASVISPDVNLLWIGLFLAALVSGIVFLLLLARIGLVAQYGRGFDRVLGEPRRCTALTVLRVVDIAAYSTRVACAMAIVGVPIASASYVILLGVIALLVGLFPVRLGFREAALAFAAGLFGQQEIGQSTFNQLALIESAGEALVYIPLGAGFLPWLRRRWLAARREEPQQQTAEPRTPEQASSDQSGRVDHTPAPPERE